MLRTFFIVSCFVSFAFNLFLYPWHIRHSNVPGLSILSWLTVASFAYGINASIFHGDELLEASPYCDVATKVLMGTQMGVSISLMCYAFQFSDWLCRSDYHGLKATKLLRTSTQASLCAIVPVAYMALHVAAQGHRFDIVEEFGCAPSTADSVFSIITIWFLPIIPCCVIMFYGVRTVRYFRYYNRIMSERQSSLDKLDYDLSFTTAPYGIYRVLRMSVTGVLIMLWIIFTPILPIVVFARSGSLSAFKSPELSRIGLFNTYADASPEAAAMQLQLWSIPFFSILFFLANIDLDVCKPFWQFFRKLFGKRQTEDPDLLPVINARPFTLAEHARETLPGFRRVRVRPQLLRRARFMPTDSASDVKTPVLSPASQERRRAALEKIFQLDTGSYPELYDLSRPAPKASVPDDIECESVTDKACIESEGHLTMPSALEQALQPNEHREIERQIIRNGGNPPGLGVSDARRQLDEYEETRYRYPLHDIPESPRSMTMPVWTGIPTRLSQYCAAIAFLSRNAPVSNEVALNEIVISDRYPADYQYRPEGPQSD